jgi:hypothetical protein
MPDIVYVSLAALRTVARGEHRYVMLSRIRSDSGALFGLRDWRYNYRRS